MTERVFKGLKVLELGAGAAGPISTRYLSEQGAHVIRIESAHRPDFLRLMMAVKTDTMAERMDSALMFALLNTDKQSLTVNMKHEQGADIVRRLVQWADLVCENFSPKVMPKWGLTYENLKKLKPDLVMASGCLFGQTGPDRLYPGFGGQGTALSGFAYVTGWPGRETVGPFGTITDSLSPKYVACAIAAALFHRRRTGEGRYIDVSQIETAVYSMSAAIVRQSANNETEERRGNHDEFAAPHNVYPTTGDDRWIAIAVQTDTEWTALKKEMGNPEALNNSSYDSLEGRVEAQEHIDKTIGEWSQAFDRNELMSKLQAAGVEAGALNNQADLLEDPALNHRGHFVWLEHKYLGRAAFERPGFRLSESGGGFDKPGPLLGEHNREILTKILGYTIAEIDRLTSEELFV
ncbi:MAG: CoA transferase [Polyangiaceae bacterium]|nr:CoA transferase [Polyangiaceae bacterium]